MLNREISQRPQLILTLGFHVPWLEERDRRMQFNIKLYLERRFIPYVSISYRIVASDNTLSNLGDGVLIKGGADTALSEMEAQKMASSLRLQ